MGYRIQYGQTVTKESFKETVKKKNSKAVVIIAAACIMLMLIYAVGTDRLQKYIYPGDAAVTEEALHTFAENLREGKSVKAAFTNFCKGIINGADIS